MFADVAGAEEARSSARSRSSSSIWSCSRPSAPRSPRCPAGRTAGHRQDPAGPRGGRRGRRPVLLHLRLGLRRRSSRRRIARRATSSSRPSPTRPRSSSTRSTPLGAIAGPGSVVTHEREQTLNQLLVEMDGFYVSGGVILIAAINSAAQHPDPRRRRLGRFDRQIQVSLPGSPRSPRGAQGPCPRQADGSGCRPAGGCCDPLRLHRCGSGQRAQRGGPADRPFGRDPHRQPGPRRGDRPRDRWPAEAHPGHGRGRSGSPAITRAGTPWWPHFPATTRCTRSRSCPCGRALGLHHGPARPGAVLHDPQRDAQPVGLHAGGRAAEELVFHDPTTGASNDIEKATAVARAMVTQYGMTERLEPSGTARRPARSSSAATWAIPGTTPRRSQPRSTRRSAASSTTPTTRPSRRWTTARARPIGHRAVGEGDPEQGAGGHDLRGAAPATLAAGLDRLGTPRPLGPPSWAMFPSGSG